MQAEHVTTRRRNVKGQAKSSDFHALSHSVRLFLGLASARRDFSFNLLSPAIQLCANTQETLGHFSRETATIDRLSESVSALREALGRLEGRDFDGDDVLEEDVENLAGTLIDSFNAILSTLEFIIRKEPLSSSSKRLLGQSMIFMYVITEKRQVITSTVAQLDSLLLKIERRRAIKVFQIPRVVPNNNEFPDSSRHRENNNIIRASGQWTQSSNCLESEDIRSLRIARIECEIASLPWHYVSLSPPRPCLLIMFFFATFVALSCFLGVYFTLNKSYGYSMGDAFTLAGWVVAVGAFISTAILAYHYPRCECWEPPDHPQRSRRGSYEMLNLAELSG